MEESIFLFTLKKDAFIEIEPEIWLQLKDLGLTPGLSFFYQGIKYTKYLGFVSFNLAAKWKRKRLEVAPEEGWFILTNLDDLDSVIRAYKQRFNIERSRRHSASEKCLEILRVVVIIWKILMYQVND